MVVRVLCVAEKPSVAKELAHILSKGSFRTRDGRSKFNKVFEFECDMMGQRCQVRMTSVLGHMMELEFERQYRYGGFALRCLFVPSFTLTHYDFFRVEVGAATRLNCLLLG
jgi:DNA topoisomerase IA